MPNVDVKIKRTRRVVRASIRDRMGILGKADGTLECDESSKYWARWVGKKDANGNATYSQPFKVWAGSSNYLPNANRLVRIGRRNNKLTILGPVEEDLVNAGYDQRLHNPNNPYNKFVYTPNIVTFRSDPLANEGEDTFEVNLEQILYKDAYGNYSIWNGTGEGTHIDVSALKPMTLDEHCLAIVSLRTLENNWQTLASTPKSNNDPLNIADLQEAADKLDPECIDSRVYRLAYDMDTLIANPVTDWDLRQWINVPPALGNPNPIVKRMRVRAGQQLLYQGILEITGDLEILGELVVIGVPETVTPVVPQTVGITETEIDFGTTAVYEKEFTITDAGVSASTLLMAVQSAKAATGKDQDENLADGLILRAVAGSGQFTLYASAMPGPVKGKFKINYMRGVA